MCPVPPPHPPSPQQDKLLDEKINQALQAAGGMAMATTQAPTAPVLSASGGLSGLNVTCSALASQNCGVLDAICPLVNCPTVCNKCRKYRCVVSGLLSLIG